MQKLWKRRLRFYCIMPQLLTIYTYEAKVGIWKPAGMSRIEIVILLFVLAAVASVLFVWSRSRLPVSGKFDRVLACGDGYYLVIKEADKGNEKMIGVADAEGRWIQPLSEYHIFLEKGGWSDISVKEEKENTTAGDIYYINEGMFLMIRREGGRNGYAGIVYNAGIISDS